MTKEVQLTAAITTAENLYAEAIRLHVIYCAKKGEDQYTGAHMDWENSVGVH